MRRRSSGVVLFAGVFGAVLIGTAGPAAACSCAGYSDPEALATAEVVFTGELLEVRTPPGDTFSSADPERFVFAVDRVYKGDARETQSVVTPREGASCGLELVGRGPFLVFASTEPFLDLEIDEGELFSHLCTGSRSVTDVPVPESFGAGAPPTAGASPVGAVVDPGEDEVGRLPGVAAATLGAVAAVVGAGYLGARWRRQRPGAEDAVGGLVGDGDG